MSYVLLGRLCALPGRAGGALGQRLLLSLIVVALLIDGFALSRVVSNWFHFGMTPVRLLVAGTNVVLLIFLAGNLWKSVSGSGADVDAAERRSFVARYLPVFALWGLCAAVVIPLSTFLPRPSPSFLGGAQPEPGCLYVVGATVEAIDLGSGVSHSTVRHQTIASPRWNPGIYRILHSATLALGDRRLVTAWIDGGVEVVDLVEGKSVGVLAIKPAYIVSADRDGGVVYVSSRDRIHVFDPASLQTILELPIPRPYESAVAEDRIVTVSIVENETRSRRELRILSTDGTGTPLAIDLTGIRDVAVGPDSESAFVLFGSNGVARVDVSSGDVVARSALPQSVAGQPRAVMAGPNGDVVYVLSDPPYRSDGGRGLFARIEDEWLPSPPPPQRRV